MFTFFSIFELLFLLLARFSRPFFLAIFSALHFSLFEKPTHRLFEAIHSCVLAEFACRISYAFKAMSSGDIYCSSRRRTVVVAVALVMVVIIMLTAAGLEYHEYGFRHFNNLISRTMKDIVTSPHRKMLLSPSDDIEDPNRIMGDIKACSHSDVMVNQDPSHPLPSGIPTYTVQITNTCTTGCDIARIHIRCGWFSSARLIDPSLFKRVRYDDCLVNGGKPIPNGQTISFQYANTYSYPLAVTSMKCVQQLP